VTESLKLKTLYGLSLLFLLLNVIFMTREQYWFALLPLVLVIVLLAFYSIDTLLMVVVFCTPLAINLQKLDFGVGVSLPTEPIMFGIMLLFLLKIIAGSGFDKKVLYYPTTIAILINLSWILITSLASELPVVSLKFFLSRLWFVVSFYFLATQLFKNFSNVKRFIWLYTIPLVGVIIYTTVRHANLGYSEKAAHWVMEPFYNDHTAYAAAIAMFIPIIIAFITNKRYSFNLKLFTWILLLILITAVVLSYTRAAWISLLVAFMVFLLFKFKINTRILIMGGVTMVLLFFIFKNDILQKLERNRQDSSSDYASHVKSITNISTDASNLERINRWNSALRMFALKPIFGWGPGTYAFKYAPFQLSKDKTIISTNAGNKGNAHSEYIGPLAESGVLGALTYLFILVVFIYKGAKLYHSSKNEELRLIALGTLLGLITYVVHGSLNNFLDTDKISVPFWGFIAILTALDVYHKERPADVLSTTSEQSNIV
jgi:putative inorganic carbon (HCO3(-)) transporter